MKEKKLTHGDKTKIKILTAGCELWRKSPEKITASQIAKHLNMTHSAVLYHFPNDIRDAVAEYAVKVADSHVIVQLIATNHSAVNKLSEKQKSTHMKVIKITQAR